MLVLRQQLASWGTSAEGSWQAVNTRNFIAGEFVCGTAQHHPGSSAPLPARVLIGLALDNSAPCADKPHCTGLSFRLRARRSSWAASRN